jgi:hypothetical protein
LTANIRWLFGNSSGNYRAVEIIKGTATVVARDVELTSAYMPTITQSTDSGPIKVSAGDKFTANIYHDGDAGVALDSGYSCALTIQILQ